MRRLNSINIQQLNETKRILLAEELWDNVAKNQGDLEVTDSQRKILYARMAA